MPRTNIDYSNTIIYKLCCKDITITEIYIGHTTDMRKRKWGHKSSCNNETIKSYNYYVYQFIRDNNGWDNWDMIEVERFEAIDGNDAKKRERYWIEELKATLNRQLPLRTKKEGKKVYYENNKENHKEYSKYYYENNKEKIIEKKKIYRNNNKEKIIENSKDYYENNKEKIKEKIECECGCKIRKSDLARHMKSQKHQEIISSIKQRTSACDVETTVI